MPAQSQSAQINDIVAALVKAQDDLRHAHKDRVNGGFKNKYATLESVIDAVKEAFAKNGLVVVQQPGILDGKPVLQTTLAHTSGQWFCSCIPVMNEKNTAQGMGSGLTYARRYALAAIANIGQDDDDGSEASKPGDKPKPLFEAGPKGHEDEPWPPPASWEGALEPKEADGPPFCEQCGEQMRIGPKTKQPYCYACWKEGQKTKGQPKGRAR